MSVHHSSGYLITLPNTRVTVQKDAVARNPESKKKGVFHHNAPTAEIALQVVAAWCDANPLVLHEPVAPEVTPTVIEVVPAAADDCTAPEIELPTGGFEAEVFEALARMRWSSCWTPCPRRRVNRMIRTQASCRNQ